MAINKALLTTLIVLCALFTSTQAITDAQMLDLLDYIQRDIFDLSAPNRIDRPSLLQAAFHDCTQGCDGSINITEPANARLTRTVNRLERSYQDSAFTGVLSKGDFAVLVETYAAGFTLSKANQDSANPFTIAENTVVFKYGRPAHTGAFDDDDDEGPFAKGTENWEDTYDSFQMCTKGVFGDGDENQLVALLGAHQIGRAKQQFSGFNGRWRPCGVKDKLSNEMFKFITGLGKPWQKLTQTLASENTRGDPNLPKDNIQWTRVKRDGTAGTGKILINADIGMYHELDVNADGVLNDPSLLYCSQGNNANANVVDCGAGHIPLNTDGSANTNANTNTANMAWQYARDQKNFHENFIAAWQKLMTVPAGTETLTDFTYGLRCVTDSAGVTRPRCVGDLFFQECVGFTVPTC